MSESEVQRRERTSVERAAGQGLQVYPYGEVFSDKEGREYTPRGVHPSSIGFLQEIECVRPDGTQVYIMYDTTPLAVRQAKYREQNEALAAKLGITLLTTEEYLDQVQRIAEATHPEWNDPEWDGR